MQINKFRIDTKSKNILGILLNYKIYKLNNQK